MGNCCPNGPNDKYRTQPGDLEDEEGVPSSTDEVDQTISDEEPGSRPIRVIALYDYKARDKYELSFEKGDIMQVDDDSQGDWLFVTHLSTKTSGYVPGNYVAPETSVESEDWYFDVSRNEAENIILSQETLRGTFLVRPSEHNKNGYTVSVKDWANGKGYHAKHYKILPLKNGRFCLSSSMVFETLRDLVDHYSKATNGLCHALTIPCKRTQPNTFELSYTYHDKWEVERTEITLISRLGNGNFGEVFYGKWKNEIEVAVKTMKEGTTSIDAFLEEAAIMKKIRHKKLVTLYGVCTKEEPIYIIQEYMSHGSLVDFLRNDEGKTLDFKDLLYIAHQTASGMEYLESRQLVHRDLAARNVLLGKNLVAKICDFGLARIMEGDEYNPKKGSKFPVKWTAPEAVLLLKFSVKSDVWSFGVFLMELFTYGQVPYPGITSMELIDLLNTGYRMPRPKNHMPDSLYDLVLKCWNSVPEERPTFHYLVYYFETYAFATEKEYKEVSF